MFEVASDVGRKAAVDVIRQKGNDARAIGGQQVTIDLGI